MRWQGGRRSSNVEDRRRRPGRVAGGISGLGIAVALVLYLLTGDAEVALQLLDAGPAPSVPASPDDAQADFISVILADTEDVWAGLFEELGQRYRPPRLVLFSDSVASACGMQSSAVGPFYCPGDQKAYIDLSFFGELHRRFGAPGDFAQAYVLAHEVGHHVQHLLGTSSDVQRRRSRLPPTEANQLSVRQELQADCYAGVWAHHAHRQRALLEAGDVEEGLRAAAAIGDDTLQKASRGYAVPESFTHGSAAQRVRWFQAGLEGGAVGGCDTFAVASP